MLEGLTYVPLLYVRLAEMRALTELPTATKNLIIPVIRLRPWLSSRSFQRAVEVIEDAIGERSFGFDLDESRRGHRETEAYREFGDLFDPANGFANYYKYVESVPPAIPVLRLANGSAVDLNEQLGRAHGIERGLFVRIPVHQAQDAVRIAEACVAVGIENVVFVFDCGWGNPLLEQQAICVALVRGIIAVDPEIEVVVAGGSFPNAFQDVGHFIIPGDERPLFDAVRREVNEANITFGDWGSTREPRNDDQIMRNRPRIDTARVDGWDSWRSDGNDTYRDLAAVARNDLRLAAEPDLWGEYIIVCTADNREPSIRAPVLAASVRINLHLVLHAHFDAGGRPEIGDELVEGEL